MAVLRIGVYEETGKLIGQRILPLDGLQAGKLVLFSKHDFHIFDEEMGATTSIKHQSKSLNPRSIFVKI